MVESFPFPLSRRFQHVARSRSFRPHVRSPCEIFGQPAAYSQAARRENRHACLLADTCVNLHAVNVTGPCVPCFSHEGGPGRHFAVLTNAMRERERERESAAPTRPYPAERASHRFARDNASENRSCVFEWTQEKAPLSPAAGDVGGLRVEGPLPLSISCRSVIEDAPQQCCGHCSTFPIQVDYAMAPVPEGSSAHYGLSGRPAVSMHQGRLCRRWS